MEKLDAKTQPVGTLLSEKYFFRVPEYQRPFSWDPDNFEDLIDDVRAATRSQEYFLGTIVLHKRESLGVFDLVDGQQRLTSLMVLLGCLRDAVTSEKFKAGIQAKLMQPANVVDGIPEKVRLEVRDRQFFNAFVIVSGGTLTTPSKASLSDPERRYLKAAEIFQSKLSKLTQPDIEELITFLSQKCVVIVLATTDFDEAFRLFTIVNDRGKQLRRIDILKALNIAPDAIAVETVRNRLAQEWEETEKQLGGGTFESIFFLIRLILLKEKPQGDLLKEFEDRIFGKKLRKGEPFFALVFEYAKLYEQIFIDRDFIPEDDDHYERFRGLIHIMDTEFSASEWRACVLAYAKKFKTTKFYEFCLKIEKVFLEQWVEGMRKDERFTEYATILGNIETSKKPEDVLKSIVFDAQEIKEAAKNKNLYTAGYGRYMLLRLELLATEHDHFHEYTAKSVEHVLPQNPDANSDWAKTHNLSEISDYVNTIGNLVLLSKSKNSSSSNLDFADKKDKYLKNRVSDYPRSIQVLKEQSWTKALIAKRTQEAADLVLQDP